MHADDLNQQERAFLDASVVAVEQNVGPHGAKVRLIIGSLVVALAIIAWFWGAADTSDRLSRARFLVAEGQRVFEERPLLGLQLMREGMLAVPIGDAHTRESFKEIIQAYATKGRLLSFGEVAAI